MSLSFYEMVECTMLSLLPKLLCERLTDLTPGELTRRGIDLLLMDFDNTMLPYTTDQPASELLRWLEQMQAGGVRLCIVSNSRKLHRVPVFSEKYGVPCVMRAKKALSARHPRGHDALRRFACADGAGRRSDLHRRARRESRRDHVDSGSIDLQSYNLVKAAASFGAAAACLCKKQEDIP